VKRGPCPDFAWYTLAFALQLRKNHGKTSFRVTERRSADQHQTRFVYSTCPSRAMASTGLLASPPLAYASGDGVNLGQRKYLPSCRTKGFPTSANFESKLAVVAHYGSPRHAPYLLHISARSLYVGRYPPQPVSVFGPAPTLSPFFLLAQAILEPNLFPYNYSNILKLSHSSYLFAYEDGRDRVSRNVSI